VPARVAPVNQLRREKLHELTDALWWRLAIVLVPLALGIAAASFVSGNPFLVFLLVALVVAAAGLVGTLALANGRAKSAFLVAWANASGWSLDDTNWIEEATPLLRDGDRRESDEHVSGPLASGDLATLCHYTYEVRQTSTTSNGGTTTHWEEHPFTVVETSVTAPGIRALCLHPRSFGDNRLFDRIDSAFTSRRVVELESSELQHEYKLEVADDASDMAVRRLFEPSFIVWCVEHADSDLLFEIENDVLVVAIPEHSYDAAELDGLVENAATIAARVAGAHAESAVS
jgi:hypothetical protein